MTVVLSSNIDYGVEIPDSVSWLVLSKAVTEKSLVFTASANDGVTERSTAIRIYATDDSGLEQSVEVTQAVLAANLDVTEAVNVSKSGEEFVVVLEAESSVSSMPDWVSLVEVKSDTGLSFTFTSESYSGEDFGRYGDIVFREVASGASVRVAVSQGDVFYHEASGSDETLSTDLAKYFGDDYSSTLTSVQIYGTLNEADLLHLGSLPLTAIDIYNTTVVGEINVGTTNSPSVVDGNAIPYSFIDCYSIDDPNTTLQMVVLPSDVTHIGGYSFYGCSALSSIDLSSITEIGKGAFIHCTSLASIDLPLVTDLGYSAFYGCSSLASIDLPSATSVSTNAFHSCTSLTSITLPLATSVGSFSFCQCNSLTHIDIPMVTSIGGYAFYECTALTLIDIPLVTSVDQCAFLRCSSINSIDLPMVTSVGQNAFSGCTSLSSINIPLVIEVGNFAFSSCSSLVSIDLPLVKSVDVYAFSSCSSLSSVNLPLVTEVGNFAFNDCISLISIDLPLVTSVGEQAFKGCISLDYIDLPLVIEVGAGAFSFCTSLISIKLATSSGARLSSNDYMFVNYTKAVDAVLTVGSANIQYVNGNIFTDTAGSTTTFSEIIVL
ncbi:MAG: leucine-rich repeat protein [Rikenellaceae bacterium]